MTNELRGEAEFSVNGKTYKIKIGTNAICEAEQKLGQPWGQIFKRFIGDDLSFEASRTVVWCALREYQPDITLKEAGDLHDYQETGEALGRAINSLDDKPRPTLKAANQ
jgi:hypothetical protein